MSETKPEFNLGDTVFYAEANDYAEERVPCPVCFGKCCVTVILGNGEHQPIECDFCGRGYEGPRGSVNVAAVHSAVHESAIKGIRMDDGEWEYEVGYHDRKKAAGLFRTHAEAEAVRVVLAAEAVKSAAERRTSHALSGKKTLSWLVGYHRHSMKEAQRTAEYHAMKLSDAKLAKKAEEMDAKEAAR